MQKPTLPVSRVVSVRTTMSPRAVQSRNFGAMLILGSSQVIDTDERTRAYGSIAEVVADFGTEAPEYKCAVLYFGQSPKPSVLYIGRWAKDATNGSAIGRVLSLAEQEMSVFNGVSNGTITLKFENQSVSVTGVNLQSETNLNGVATKITEKLQSKGKCEWTGTRFVVTSVATGSASKVLVEVKGDLADKLGLGDGVRYVQGIDSEKLEKAVSTMIDIPSWYGMIVADSVDTDQAIKATELISASELSHIIGFTSTSTRELDKEADDTLGSKLKEKGFNRAIVQYSSDNPYAVASIFGRMATVNFKGSNTTITLKFKQEPGVAPEYLRVSQANALRDKNVNVFAEYNNDTAILQEGVMSGGNFIDEVHGLDWLQNEIQTALWNALYTTDRVGQDLSGVAILESVVNKVLDQANTCGLIASGIWNGKEFGLLKRGDALATGYYVYTQPLADQLQGDREARKAPPITIAVKLKGAIHSVDVDIQVNR